MKKTDFFLATFLVFLMASGIFRGVSSCMEKSLLFSDGGISFAVSQPSRLLLDKRKTVEIPIIMYHGITGASGKESEYFISADRFERDLKWYRDKGYTTILPSQLYAYAEEGARLPSKPILLSFDDGYCNNYTYAFPLLQKYNMKAVISIIGSDSDIASEDIYRVPASCNLSWGEIALMAKSGLVEFGNHTYNLHRISDGRKGANQKFGESLDAYHKLLIADIAKNQEKIQAATGSVPLLFAWPYGAYPADGNGDIALKEAGILISVNSYQHISTVRQGDTDSLLGLGRYLRTPSFDLEILENADF